jgi:T5SS/PEP-CTERM-associated repeat protein
MLGYYGGRNTLTISSGALVSSRHGIIGNGSLSDGNSATVTGASSTWQINLELIVGESGADNTLTISSGGSVLNGDFEIGLYSAATNNSLLLTGAGSRWITRGYLRLGMTWSTGNNVTVENGALAVAGNGSGDWFEINYTAGVAENHLRLNGGYVALFGDRTADIATLLLGGKTQVWDSVAGEYVSADSATLHYFYCHQTGDAASVLGYYADNYTDLLENLDVGYTLIWAVPEPSDFALLGGFGALGFVMIRRRKAAKA